MDRSPIPRVIAEGWTVGKLIAHGAARYRHDLDNSKSYFVHLQTLETEQVARQRAIDQLDHARPLDGHEKRRASNAHQGGVRELWGNDLARAIRESKSHVAIGDVVAVRMVGREALLEPIRIKEDGVLKTIEYRNRWEIEKPGFIQQRHRFAQEVNKNYQEARREGIEGKEAMGLYLIHAGVRLLAEERYRNPDDRKALEERVKNLLEVSPDRQKLIAQAVEKLNSARNAADRATADRQAGSTNDGRTKEPLTRE